MKKQWRILFVSLILVSLFISCQSNGSVPSVAAVMATQVTSYELTDVDGNLLGTVEGLVVDSDSDTITYAIVQLAQPLQPSQEAAATSDDFVVIPWDQLQLDILEKSLVFKSAPVILQAAPRLPDLPTTFTSGWDEDIRHYWWSPPGR